jgi:hypothetical protein
LLKKKDAVIPSPAERDEESALFLGMAQRQMPRFARHDNLRGFFNKLLGLSSLRALRASLPALLGPAEQSKLRVFG